MADTFPNTLPDSLERTILLYGAGGSGKTTQSVYAAEWLWNEKGLLTRVVNADGGGTRGAFAHLIEEGIAEVWDIDRSLAGSPFKILTLASSGYWPVDVNRIDSPLEAPSKSWRECPTCKGMAGGSATISPPACETCKTKFSPGQMLPVVSAPTEKASKVGLWVFEGATAFGNLLLQRLRTVDEKGGNAVKDEDFTIGQPGKQHYGMAQSYMSQFITTSRKLPVPVKMWTALEMRSDEEGRPLYGPMLPGKALTAACIPWFTDVIHLDALTKRNATGQTEKDAAGIEKVERVFYLAAHFPPDNPLQKFAAKTSAPVGTIPASMPADIGKLLAMLEKAGHAGKERLNPKRVTPRAQIALDNTPPSA